MNCYCAELKPCPIHKDKPLKMPEVVSHHLFVVDICKRTRTGKWFHTVSKDAIRVHESPEYDSKSDCINSVKL